VRPLQLWQFLIRASRRTLVSSECKSGFKTREVRLKPDATFGFETREQPQDSQEGLQTEICNPS
jgi:hypothetical protein